MPLTAHADHMPSSLAQKLDPDMLACIISVDNSTSNSRFALQSTCFERTVNLCSRSDSITDPNEIIGCLNFEAQQGVDSLGAATNDLPLLVEKKVMFGQFYQRRRERLLRSVDDYTSADEPKNEAEATDRIVRIFADLHMVFILGAQDQHPA